MISKIRSALFVAALLITGQASANAIVNLDSTVYGAFTNSIDESVASSSPYFVGRGSDYFINGEIVFTDTSGIIHNVLTTTGDNLYWSWNSVQNSLIGTLAVASSSTIVELLNNGVLTSYMGDINALNGGLGFCCSTSVQRLDIATSSATSVPEPTTIALLGLGLFGFAATRRRKQ